MKSRKKMFPGTLNVLGDFELTGPVMRVSDPGYDRDAWCCGTMDKCKTGIWEAASIIQNFCEWGDRVSLLAARHKETGPDFSVVHCWPIYNGLIGWKEQPFEVGVDSGQAGIFDDAKYQDCSIFDGMPEPKCDFGDLWFRHICDITLSEKAAGVIPFGAVSESGYGDGCYVCYTHENSRKEIDFVLIAFIDE